MSPIPSYAAPLVHPTDVGTRADDARLPPARASACERLARAIGFVHPCPRCEAEALPGSVCGFYTEEGLRRHRADVHGEAAP